MHRTYITTLIENYKREILPLFVTHHATDHDQEEKTLNAFKDFISSHTRCFENDCLPGHITGSVMLMDPSFSKVVLTLHKKLGKWLQLGGHSDGESVTQEVALREAHEESGLKEIKLFSPSLKNPSLILPFDWDIHHIPKTPKIDEHFHFDVRFLAIAYDDKLNISEESNDLKWVPIDEAYGLNQEKSMHRQFDKIKALIKLSQQQKHLL